jgi:formylmethanofuran dehydrogenase subunit D
MVNPLTGRLFVVSKEFSGSVYQAPKKLRTDRVNVLRKVGTAPIMATDAAYAPDGTSYVIRTYFSATVYRPTGESIAKVSMPELKQAESIAYTSDGKSLLTGSEGVRSPVYRVALPAAALPSTRPSTSASPRSKAAASPSARPAPAKGLSPRDVLIWLAAAVGATGVIALVARRTR